jgi:hypothetical protein
LNTGFKRLQLCLQITAFTQSQKIEEFGKVSEKEWKSRLDNVLLTERENDCKNQIYIIIYDRLKTAKTLGKNI